MKKLLSLLIIPFLIVASNLTTVSAWVYDGSDNVYFDYIPTYDESYYSSLDGLGSDSFRDELNDIITNGYNKYSYSNRYTVLRETDVVYNDSTKLWCMYTGKYFELDDNGSSGTSTFNTEHTWAKSWGFPSESSTPYSDMHHLRITECQANSYRSNSWFGEVSNPTNTDAYGNKWTSSIFEPRDSVKGDIARMLLYMDVRYDGENSEPDLVLIDGYTATSGSALHGDLETLLKWHEEDPVDDRERMRNDLVFSYQKNRNPFIDHPEYANLIWGDGDLSNYDAEKALEFDTMVSNIKTPISLDSKDAIEAASTFYDSLTALQKSLTTKYSLLLTYIDDYSDLYVSDEEYALRFDTLVTNITSPLSVDSIVDIVFAKEYYNNLNATQQQLTTKYNLLLSLESDYNNTFNNNDIAQAFDNLVLSIDENITINSKDSLYEALDFYNSLSTSTQNLTTKYDLLCEYIEVYLLIEEDNKVLEELDDDLDILDLILKGDYESLTDYLK